MSINLNILATNKTILNKKLNEVVLPSLSGELGILPFHSRLLTALEIGVLRLKINDKWVPLVILDGIAEIENNNLTIIVRQVEELSDIKIGLEEAKLELNKISDEFAKATTKKDKILTSINLRRATARFQALSFSAV
jgi:F-type H+-transporting ATPase subunit epsilon